MNLDQTQMLKNFLRTKEAAQKVPFFLSQAPTRHSFTFILQFSYELKHKADAVVRKCSIKKVLLEIYRKTPVSETLF